ncbi:MAG: AraC family transcriptional regulator ligand-binding domain-containing protein [Parvularculaceae bacterium]|nr:AraC family transcriptional regulator ligand-binding domain-containing protein [Parvularculaceae bacterium]
MLKAREAQPLFDLARNRGADIAALLSALRLDPAIFESDGLMPLGDYFRAQDLIAAALQDETMRMSERQLLPGTTDFVLSHLAGAASLNDAMKTLARSFNLLHGGEFNRVRRKGDVISFVIDDRLFPYTTKDNPAFLRLSLECVQIFLHCVLRTVSRPHADAGLRRVSVTREGRAAEAPHFDFWGAPVRFGASVYSLDYSYDAATAAIAPPRAGALSTSKVLAEITSASSVLHGAGQGAEMSDFVRRALARGVIDQTRIAALSGVSVATLRRKLDLEGTSFRELRQEILNSAAKALLARRLSVAEVADELGFSDFRAFNRAFKAWNGTTPKAFAEGFLKNTI